MPEQREPLDPRLLRWLLSLQFRINTLSSVAIEYPALRKHPLLSFDKEQR